eukprot:352252-Chlamydomonas_euryale.AAC.7
MRRARVRGEERALASHSSNPTLPFRDSLDHRRLTKTRERVNLSDWQLCERGLEWGKLASRQSLGRALSSAPPGAASKHCRTPDPSAASTAAAAATFKASYQALGITSAAVAQRHVHVHVPSSQRARQPPPTPRPQPLKRPPAG